MTKKLTALILAAVGATTAGSALVACNNKKDDPPPAVEQTQCTVTFDVDGGSAVESVTVTSGEKLTEPTAPTKDGYEFVGWYKEGMTEKWNFETDTVTDNLTLYALWNEQAATADTYFDFTATGETYEIKAKLGQTLPENVVLPAAHDGKAVTSIADEAFVGQSAITSVKIPSSVKSVGARAFRNCSKLATVSGGDNVENIGSAAFNGTAWESALSGASYLGKCLYKYAGAIAANTELTVKDGTVGIAAGAMQDAKNIVKVTLPATMKYIGNYAFGSANADSGAQITEVTIPDTVVEIGDSAFRNCSALATVKIGSGVKSIGASAFAGTAISDLTYNANAEVHATAFSSSAAATLKLGNDVTEIPVNITKGMTGLTAVTLGAEIDKVPNSAFDGLTNLATVTVNGKLTEIGNYAFRGTAITSFTIGKEVTKIGAGAFANCAKLASVNYNAANATTTTAVGAPFTGCAKLTTATVGADVTKVPSYLFYNVSALSSLTMGNNVTEIGAQALYGTAIASVTIPTKVTKIGANAFGNISALKAVTYNATAATYDGTTTLFPNAQTVTVGTGVTKIPAYFVKGNTVLQSIALPNGVAVGDYAFNGCTALGEITGYDNVGTVGAQAFDGCKYYEQNLTDGLIVQGSTITGYRGDMPANFTLDVAAIPNGKTVTAIAASAFKDKANLVAVNLPASVVTVGANAFEGTSVVGEVDLSNVTEIGAGAFKGLTNITAVTLNESVTKIGEEAFSGCTGAVMTLKADSLTELGASAFYNCEKLTEIEVDGVAEIPEHCFYGAALTSVKLGSSVETIGDSWATLSDVTTFAAPGLKHVGDSGLKNLKVTDYSLENIVTFGNGALQGFAASEVVFGENCTTLGNDLFTYFHQVGMQEATITPTLTLTKVTFKNSKVTKIPDNAFRNCTNLATVELCDSIKEVGSYAFISTGISAFDFTNITKIGDYSFCSTKLTAIDLGAVEAVPTFAFNNIKTLTSVTINESTKSIGVAAFRDSTVSSLTLKEGLQIVDNAAFMSTGISKITLPSTVTSIGEAAFSTVTEVNLDSYIPITSISLGAASASSTNSFMSTTMFVCATSEIKAQYVADGSAWAVAAGDNWETLWKGRFSTAPIVRGDWVMDGDGNFMSYKGTSWTVMTVPKEMTSFTDLSALYNVSYSASRWQKIVEWKVEEGNTHFKIDECGALVSADGKILYAFPAQSTTAKYSSETVEEIRQYAIYTCPNLTEVNLPKAKTFGKRSVYSCANLTTVVLGDQLDPDANSEVSNAFGRNSKLTSFTIKSVTPPKIGVGWFSQATNIKIYVPAESVDAYKSAETGSNWSANYADKIVAIPTEGGESGGTGEGETPAPQSLEALPDSKQNI